MSGSRPSSAPNLGDYKEEDFHPFPDDWKAPNGTIPLSEAIAQLNKYKEFACGVGDWVNDSDTLDEKSKTADEEVTGDDNRKESAADMGGGGCEGWDGAAEHGTYSSSSGLSDDSDPNRTFTTGRRLGIHTLNSLFGEKPTAIDDEKDGNREKIDEVGVLDNDREDELDGEDRNEVVNGASPDHNPPESFSESHSEIGDIDEDPSFSSLVSRGELEYRLNQERVISSPNSESGIEADEEEFTAKSGTMVKEDEVEVMGKGGLDISASSGTVIDSDDEVVDKKTARAVFREFLDTKFDAGFNRAWDRVKKRKAESIN
jgi:hypothetical protein